MLGPPCCRPAGTDLLASLEAARRNILHPHGLGEAVGDRTADDIAREMEVGRGDRPFGASPVSAGQGESPPLLRQSRNRFLTIAHSGAAYQPKLAGPLGTHGAIGPWNSHLRGSARVVAGCRFPPAAKASSCARGASVST